MIFVTVGTDGPFDRLVSAIDDWAGQLGRDDVVAQIGRSNSRPKFIEWHEMLDPAEFKRLFSSASLIVAHAGMGTILSALRYEKPLIVMPRRACLGEQRNEHQLATAKQLAAMGRISVASDEVELISKLNRLDEQAPVVQKIGPYADAGLIRAVSDFIHRKG